MAQRCFVDHKTKFLPQSHIKPRFFDYLVTKLRLQERRCAYIVTFRRVRIATVAMGKQ